MANPPNIPFSQLNPAQVQGLGPLPTQRQLLFPQPGAVMILPPNQGNGTQGYIRTKSFGAPSSQMFTMGMWVYLPSQTFRDYSPTQSILEFGLPQNAPEPTDIFFYMNKYNDAFDSTANGGTVFVSKDPNDPLPDGTPEWVWFQGTYFHYEAYTVDNPFNKVCSLSANASRNNTGGELYAEFHDVKGNLIDGSDFHNPGGVGNTKPFVSDQWTPIFLSVAAPANNFPYAGQEFSFPCLEVNFGASATKPGPIAIAQVQIWTGILLNFLDPSVVEVFAVTDLTTGQPHPTSPFIYKRLSPLFNTIELIRAADAGQVYYYPPAFAVFGAPSILLDGYASEIVPISGGERPAFWENKGVAGPFEHNNLTDFFPGP